MGGGVTEVRGLGGGGGGVMVTQVWGGGGGGWVIPSCDMRYDNSS